MNFNCIGGIVMKAKYIREMSLYADGVQVGAGCRMRLKGETYLDLRPGHFELHLFDLAPSPAALIASCREVEVRSGNSILARGELDGSETWSAGSGSVTSVYFSSGISLWEAACTISLAPGLKVSDSVKAILRESETGVSLAGYTAEDPVVRRPQSFFGRITDPLEMLAESAKGTAFLNPAGLVICGDDAGETPLLLGERDILEVPSQEGEGIILRTRLTGWPEGVRIRYAWKELTGEGRLVSRRIEADTIMEDWVSALILE